MISFLRVALPPKQCLYTSNCNLPLSLSLTVTNVGTAAIFFLNSLNVWQLRVWAAAALVVFHSTNCNPPPLLPLPFSSRLCCTVPPIISGFTAQSLLPWNATSRGIIKQVVFIMEAQTVWPYKQSQVLHVSGLSALLGVVSQIADLYKDLSL